MGAAGAAHHLSLPALVPRYVGGASAILEAVTNAAESGAPCPSNAALAAAIGFSSPGSVSYHLGQLEAAGLIRVEMAGRNKRRIHLADGRATGWGTRRST